MFGRRPVLEDEVPGAVAVRIAGEKIQDLDRLKGCVLSGMSRIDVGLEAVNRRFPDAHPTDVLLDHLSELTKALRETRARLEKGLAELDERRGVDGGQT